MIYDIFVYSYSRVHVNGFWEIIITFLFLFLILIYFFYFFTSGIMFRILIMHVKFGSKTTKTYCAEKKPRTNVMNSSCLQMVANVQQSRGHRGHRSRRRRGHGQTTMCL